MIDNQILKRMTKVQLDEEFLNDMKSLKNIYNSNHVAFVLAGISPETAIDDLFREIKQIWLQRLTLELKGGE